MKIYLNGKPVKSNSRTLQELILEKGFNPEALIAEVNLELIKKEKWQELSVREGDTIELLNFVGGG